MIEARKSSIPPHAKIVFKGILFEVWQWEQKMFDGSVEFFEHLRRPNTVVVVSTVGDKILIEIQEQPHRSKPFLSLPGGRCGWEEDPLAAAKRELLEETGYESDDWTLWKELNPVGKIEWTVYTYIARNCVKKQEPHLDAGEKIAAKLIDFEEFLMLAEDPSFYERELISVILQARFDPKAKEELYNLLFRTS